MEHFIIFSSFIVANVTLCNRSIWCTSHLTMSLLGFQLNLASPQSSTEKPTLEALKVGFRHVRFCPSIQRLNSNILNQVDSAIMYRNEKACGKAIEKSGIDRSEIFFTTKIPPGSMGYEQTKKAIDGSLRDAEQKYFDLCVSTLFDLPRYLLRGKYSQLTQPESSSTHPTAAKKPV